jgi:hypothetical protein
MANIKVYDLLKQSTYENNQWLTERGGLGGSNSPPQILKF